MRICGTGHRPNKLGGYGQDVFNRVVTLAKRGLYAYEEYEGVSEVISGGALGWDQALAEAALELKMPLTLALPFEGFEGKWPQASQDFLRSQIERATKIVYVCEPGYGPWKMQQRNKWMVDNSDHVFALWDGSAGGTGNCIKYVQQTNKPFINYWDKYANQVNVSG
jgi:uncharacterized phage-like protein YoqJ